MLTVLPRDVYGPGIRAKEIGLIDRFGGIEDAINSAASMAKLTDYRIRRISRTTEYF